jgi:hypothetical protein
MLNQTRTKSYPFGGGLDLVTPALSVRPGRALGLYNYEPWFQGGYRRINGYERFDGRPAPSAAQFVGFELVDASGLTTGTTVTGDTSGATGVVIGVDGDTIGVTKVVGTFEDGEGLNTGAYVIASEPVSEYAPTEDLTNEWTLAAQEEYRSDITEVPGSGIVRGAWRRGTNIYAVRDNAGATAGVLHLASVAGWTTSGITLAHYVFFDAGGAGAAVALPEEGDAINGQTSGATATVHRVVLHGGATGTNDAYGYLVLTDVTGTFQDNENLREGATAFAVAASDSSQFAFAVGGTYQFLNHNFYGGSATFRTYGVSGVGPAFEIDENNVVSPLMLPVVSEDEQPPSNVPYLIEEHRNYLFLAFPGGSLVHTVIGDPLVVNGFLGAAEFGIGDEITGLNSVAGGVLVVSSAKEVRGLFGADLSDWELRLIGEKTGAKAYSAQKLDTVYALDDLGITSVARTDAFGDFVGSTVSQMIQPLIREIRSSSTASTVVRGSNQYRIYFDDGSSIVMYVPNAGMENDSTVATATAMRVEFGFLQYPIVVRKIYNTEDETGAERTYFASDDGFVYEDQIGTNFDGEAIESACRLHYFNAGSPAVNKKFRRANIEIESESALEFSFNYDLDFGNIDTSDGQFQVELVGGGGFFDVDLWDTIVYDGQSSAFVTAPLDGSGANVGMMIYNTSAVARPWVLKGATIHYDPRRLKR